MLNALLIIFVIAKILGFITWSWWIVLSPLLIQVSIVLLSLVFYGVANFRIKNLLKKLKKELKERRYFNGGRVETPFSSRI